MELKTQPSAMPTRKLVAVIVAGAVLGGAQAGLDVIWPDHPFAPFMEQFGLWIQAGVMVAAGYLVKDRA